MVTRITDYNFEIPLETAVAMREQWGVDAKALKVSLQVASEASMQGTERVWTPHLRRIIVNGVQEREIPAEFQKGGACSLAAAGPTPEAATHALCEKYLFDRR